MLHNCANRGQYRATDGELYTVYTHKPIVRVWDRQILRDRYNVCSSLLAVN